MKIKVEVKETPFLWQFQADKYPVIEYFKRCLNAKPEGGWTDEQKQIAEQVKEGLEHVLESAGNRKWFTVFITDKKTEIGEDEDIFSI
jgi:hypothetical protein